MIRRLLCRLGIHRWQILYEPPHARGGVGYRKAVFCVFCSKEHPCPPGALR